MYKALEKIYNKLLGVPTTAEAEGYVENATDVTGSHDITTANDKTPTQMFEIQKSGIYALSIDIKVDALETAGEGGVVSFKVYKKTDGTNYNDIPAATIEYAVGGEIEGPSFEFDMVHEYSKLMVECSDDVTATRAVVYRYIVRDLGA